jgi:hypothetical protein
MECRRDAFVLIACPLELGEALVRDRAVAEGRIERRCWTRAPMPQLRPKVEVRGLEG